MSDKMKAKFWLKEKNIELILKITVKTTDVKVLILSTSYRSFSMVRKDDGGGSDNDEDD